METSHAIQESNTPRTFDAHFKDRYSSNKYNYEGKRMVTNISPDSGKNENYQNNSPKVESNESSLNFSLNLGPLSWLFYFALFASVGYLLYILLNEGGSGLFSSNRYKKLDDFDDITSENIENADINSLISNAETNGDYRLAIRYYNLLVLKTLAIKNHIKFGDDKTNADYLNDIKLKPFAGAFEYTSYLYNYIWYGKFQIEIQQYTQAKDKFVTLLNQLK